MDQLRSFNPAKLTLDTTRKMKPLVGELSMVQVEKNSKAVAALYAWVRTVYAQASFDERSLSNYAVLSPRLAHTPFAKMRRFQPAPREVVPPY